MNAEREERLESHRKHVERQTSCDDIISTDVFQQEDFSLESVVQGLMEKCIGDDVQQRRRKIAIDGGQEKDGQAFLKYHEEERKLKKNEMEEKDDGTGWKHGMNCGRALDRVGRVDGTEHAEISTPEEVVASLKRTIDSLHSIQNQLESLEIKLSNENLEEIGKKQAYERGVSSAGGGEGRRGGRYGTAEYRSVTRMKEEQNTVQAEGVHVELAHVNKKLESLKIQKDRMITKFRPFLSKLETLQQHRTLAMDGALVLECLAGLWIGAQDGFLDNTTLPSVLKDSSRLKEAMVTIATLQNLMTRLINDVSTDFRSGTDDSRQLEVLKNMSEQLDLQRNILDNKVVARFDVAVTNRDIVTMAECSKIMAAADEAMEHGILSFQSDLSMENEIEELLSLGKKINGSQVDDCPNPKTYIPIQGKRERIQNSGTYISGMSLLLSRYISTRPVFVERDLMNIGVVGSDEVHSESPTKLDNSGTIADKTTQMAVFQEVDRLEEEYEQGYDVEIQNELPRDSFRFEQEIAGESTYGRAKWKRDMDYSFKMRIVTNLFHKLSIVLRDEAMIMEQIFPDFLRADILFVQRVFEQVVAETLRWALYPMPKLNNDRENSNLELLRSYLSLFTECYRKTLALAEEATGLIGSHEGITAYDLAEESFGNDLLESYLSLECGWLETLGSTKLLQPSIRTSIKNGIDVEIILDLISMHEESLKRCLQLTQNSSATRAQYLKFLWLGADALAGDDSGLSLGEINGRDNAVHVSSLRSITLLKELHISSYHSFSEIKTKKAPLFGLLEQSAIYLLNGISASGEECIRKMKKAFKARNVPTKAAHRRFVSGVPQNLDFNDKYEIKISKFDSQGSDFLSDAVTLRSAHQRACSVPDAPLALSLQCDETLEDLATSDVENSIVVVFKTLNRTSESIKLLKSHYSRNIMQYVAGHPSLAVECSEGMENFVSAIDQRITKVLEHILVFFKGRFATILSSEQSRNDFRPSSAKLEINQKLDSGTGNNPTKACEIAVALLRAMCDASWQHMHKSNALFFIIEISRIIAGEIEKHAWKYVFNPEGALQWRRDVAEFASCMREQWNRALNEEFIPNPKEMGSLRNDLTLRTSCKHASTDLLSIFENLEALANLLVVPPAGIPGLLDLLPPSIPLERALRIVERREDFKTARIGELSLSEIFRAHKEKSIKMT